MISSAYAPPSFDSPIDLDLSKNEGATGPVSRYPDASRLRTTLAGRLGLDDDQVLVTAGGDDALLRCFLANAAGRIATTAPTFEMIPRYAAQARAELTEVPWWDGPLPAAELVASGADVAVVASPNNPTGSVADETALRAISASFDLVVLDAAYAEFAEEDLTVAALRLGNVVVVRSLSKAFGLAGLRVGYLLGPPPLIAEISRYGNPYPVSSVSLEMAEETLAGGSPDLSDAARRRESLADLLAELGAAPLPSQANFVLATEGADWLVPALAALGVAARSFPDNPILDGCARITAPRDETEMSRLESALRTVLAPDALLFDLDGVLADVTGSYRATVIAVAAAFGVVATQADIEAVKAEGDANDDWRVTQRILEESGETVPFETIVERFESIYQGAGARRGLKENERPLIDRETLAELAERYPLGVVTGRPRSDADEFLDRHGLKSLFGAVVTREDAPFKPDPAPVRLAMERLGAAAAWMLGDTRDDLESARAAGALPIAVGSAAPDLAAITLESVSQIKEILR